MPILTMNWKEQFNQLFSIETDSTNGILYPTDQIDFISTEIIEKLIADTELLIAEDWASDKYPIEECLMMSEGVVRKLRDKWL